MKQIKTLLRTLMNPILAGMFISLGAYIYFCTPEPLNALLCSIGLIATLHCHTALYTTTIHLADGTVTLIVLALCYVLNCLGCWLSSLIITNPCIVAQCEEIIAQRTELEFWQIILRGMGSGLMLTLCAHCWEKHSWMTLIGVPTCIYAGFVFPIADTFCYFVSDVPLSFRAILAYHGIIIGSFVGGQIYKLGTRRAEQ